jgi:hypothetical protein
MKTSFMQAARGDGGALLAKRVAPPQCTMAFTEGMFDARGSCAPTPPALSNTCPAHRRRSVNALNTHRLRSSIFSSVLCPGA